MGLDYKRKSKESLSCRDLFSPVNNHSSCASVVVQSFEVGKHEIPFRSKLIIPEEIPNNIWTCILKYGSTPINNRTCLTKNNTTFQAK